ncbi:hypothetical protein ACLPJK_26065 [Pseudomonas aeruginosa]|uniref:hypothetical protein n=1 Tax=Pseudomonas aeruginosa TaxID=287 RepID=UPI003D2D53A4
MANDTPPVFIVDPDRRFTTWNIYEIYGHGTDTAEAVYVPNERDLVIDYQNGLFICSAVDYTTGLSELIPWTIPGSGGGVTDEDVLLGVGPAETSEGWRIYLDVRKYPHVLRVDGRWYTNGTDAVQAKLFKGTDLSASGEVISMYYDQGAFRGENIPLESDPLMPTRRVVRPFNTDRKLLDGELVTLVIYSSANVVVEKRKFLIENTDLIRATEESMRYVESIRLSSPFLSPADPTVILFPINDDIASVPMHGIVRYADGQEAMHPVTFGDQGKFSLFGIDHYVSTIEGDRIPLTLNYRLSEDELSYGGDVTPNGTLTERYWAVTKAADWAYSLKLYAFPVWRSEVDGYELDFYLCNLDRRVSYAVPRDLVHLKEGSPAFNGLDYLSLQRLTVQVELNKVDPVYTNYLHTQSLDVSLKRPGTEAGNRWEVGFTYNQSPRYGLDLEAPVRFINTNSWRLNLKNGFPSRATWLQKLYYAINPLYDTRTEPGPLEPTHFTVRTHRRSYTYPLDMWDQDLTLNEAVQTGQVITIEWLRRLPDTDLVLGVSGLAVTVVAA